MTLCNLMSVTFRASGTHFDVDAFLRESDIAPAAVFRRGQPRFPASQPDGQVLDHSGINVSVSDVEFGNIEQQTRDTLQFLADNLEEVARLKMYPGVEGLELDFAVMGNDEVFVESYRFAPELLRVIADLGVTLCVSRYVPANDAIQ